MRKKIIWKIVCTVLLSVVFFLLILLINSANWFLDNFHEVEIATALYQITSPLKGTEEGVLSDYINQCLNPSISFAVICMVIYRIWDMIAGYLLLEVDIRVASKNLRIGFGKSRFAKAGKVIALWAAIAILGIGVWDRAVAVGLPEYIYSVMNTSEIFETEYVNPDTVAITFPDKKRNLILIYLESMESTYASTEAGGGKPNNYIPELTELAKENLQFSDDEDLGGARYMPRTGWTMAGLLSSTTGVPYKLPIEGNDAGKYEKFVPGLKGLGEVFQENGYQNYFMCGSEAVFGGRELFFTQHGDYHIIDYNSAKEEGIIPEDYHVFWGMEDSILYEYAKQKLTEIAGQGEPFNFTMLTVDTHPPEGYVCSLCDNTYSSQYENVLACSSKQAVSFINWAKEQEWYDNTTIVITGDHLSMKKDIWDDIGDYERTVYNCFLNLPEGVSPVRHTNREFTVLDMFPTVLTAVGVDIEGDSLGLGTHLFSERTTLPEEMGFDVFNRELELYSDYYYMNFVVGDN